MKPYERLAEAAAPDGTVLTLYRHDGAYLLRIDGIELMSTRRSQSEVQLAELACRGLADQPGVRVLVGGLGFGFTMRAALERLGPDAQVMVAEIVPEVIAWNRNPEYALAGAAMDGLAERVASVVHVDLSGVFGGEDHVVIACDPTPVRYQYLMRRKIHTAHEAYLEHYVNNHAKFGLRTPGIEGYVQFHIDADSSRALATIAGLGLWSADSVSELHVASVDTMLEGFASSPTLGDEAGIDEDRFVDRANSVMFTSDVVHRSST